MRNKYLLASLLIFYSICFAVDPITEADYVIITHPQ